MTTSTYHQNVFEAARNFADVERDPKATEHDKGVAKRTLIAFVEAFEQWASDQHWESNTFEFPEDEHE